jgi:hypothetical protein
MSIDKVNYNGWTYKSSLTATQLNQLDTNLTYVVDKRQNQTDTIESDLTFDSNSSITLSSGSLTVDATKLYLYPGTIKLTEIIGDGMPLSLGQTAFPFTGPYYVMSDVEVSNTFVILTGVKTSDVILYMPIYHTATLPSGADEVLNSAGSIKVFDNRTTGDAYFVTIVPLNENGNILPIGNVTLPNNRATLVHCDGSYLYNSFYVPPYSNKSLQFYNSTATPGTTYFATLSTTPVQVTNCLFTFNDVEVGDAFEINYNVVMDTTNSSQYATTVVKFNSTALNETSRTTNSTTAKAFNMTITYISGASGVVTLGLFLSIGTGYVATLYNPISFSVKHLKK